MPSRRLDIDVFEAALTRMTGLYEEGHRIVVAFSAGKDSGVCLEIAILAASLTGKLPVEVAMRDEEIMLPGSFEYAERVARRPEVDFHWIVANQPVVNCFNRREPYFWTFDPQLEPDQWVRRPPTDIPRAPYTIDTLHISGMVDLERFPPPEGKELFVVIGLRTEESPNRKMGLHSSKGWLTGKNRWGQRTARPIYDWQIGDVWKAHHDNGWDYNRAYNTMYRLRINARQQRIAPPTLSPASLRLLQVGARAWPSWFDRVSRRLPGVRTAVQFGRRSVEPDRRLNESWEECFHRTCLGDDTPEWIKDRARTVMEAVVARHESYSTTPLPETRAGPWMPKIGSWRQLTQSMFMGDPFCLRQKYVKYVEPEFFRKDAGTWEGGKPTW